MPAFRDLRGQIFGKWTVLAHEGKTSSGHTWLCRCECGTQRTVIGDTLKKGLSKSCGCMAKEWCTTHGRSKTPEYWAWAAMLQRCDNPKNKWYQRYGGRGIKVCERWYKFENFLADMGEKPPGLSLERQDNDADYRPGNCKWATGKEQIRNRDVTPMVEFEGRRISVSELAERAGLERHVVLERIKRGWSLEQVLSKQRFGRWGATKSAIR